MVEEDRMSSIAFPTVGCGKLGFDPRSVAHCFIQAQRTTQSTVQARTYCLLLVLYNKRVFTLLIEFMTMMLLRFAWCHDVH